jgi:hypothetical protein
MAEFEPFFFYTQGQGVIYLAFQLASFDEYSGQTYMAIGAFQNINPLSDGKMIYHLDGRYSDQMNETSMFGKTLVSETMVHTKANMKKFMKSQKITSVDPDIVTLYSQGDFYWFVQNGILPNGRSRSASVKKSVKSRSNAHTRKRSASRGKKRSRSRSKSRSKSR